MTALWVTGDTLDVLRKLPDGSVDLVFTSPPFLALRSYLPADDPAKAQEIGQEPTPGAFLDVLLDITEECARVLAPHGSLCVELGDTYSGSGGAGGDWIEGSGQRVYKRGSEIPETFRQQKGPGWPQAKSLCLIPELYRLALAYGRNPLTGRTTEPWRVRNVVRWCRPNPPVGALGDKFRPGTSDLVVACKSGKRYFDLDAVREEPYGINAQKQKDGWTNTGRSKGAADEPLTTNARERGGPRSYANPAGAPPLDWWEIPTQPYAGSHYACVDDQTEALTRTGWKAHGDLIDGDEIAAYDIASRNTRWQPATFHRYQFHGELVAIEKRETSQRLTPNHRVLYRTVKGFEHVGRADTLLSSHRLPVAAPFDVEGDGPGMEMAALLGWYVTEGSTGKNVVYLWQSESANPKHCARIRELLDVVGTDYTERRRVRGESVEVCWAIRGLTAWWLLTNAPGKALTADVLGWSDEECGALLDALIDGDGHTRPSGRRQFIQKSKATIDMVQALVCRLGLRSTISPRREGGWSLTIGERSWLSLRGTDGVTVPVGRERYVGTVWCPSVETGFWLARRNGRPFITGNTFPEQLVVRPVKAMCPLEVCTTCGEPRRRITSDPTYTQSRNGGTPAVLHQQEGERVGEGVNQWATRGMGDSSVTRQAETLGWTDCGHDTFRPGRVLDIFGGSGTTLAVATGHGRDAIGIDLDTRNVDLARDRIGPMFFQDMTVGEVAAWLSK